mgnify:CR=1 FL=1
MDMGLWIIWWDPQKERIRQVFKVVWWEDNIKETTKINNINMLKGEFYMMRYGYNMMGNGNGYSMMGGWRSEERRVGKSVRRV